MADEYNYDITKRLYIELRSPMLSRFSKAFMINIVAAFLQGWHITAWTDIRRGAACRAGFIHVPTV